MKYIKQILIVILMLIANNNFAMEKENRQDNLDIANFHNNQPSLKDHCAKKIADRLADDLINERDYSVWLDLQKLPEIIHEYILLALCKYHSDVVWRYLSDSIAVKSLTENAGDKSHSYSVKLSHENRFVSAYPKVWDLIEKTILFKDEELKTSAISLDDKIIAIVTKDNSIKIYDTECYEFLPISFQPQNETISAIVFSNNNELITANTAGIIKSFDIKTGNCLKSFETPDAIHNELNLITSICVSPDNKFIITFTYTKILRIWNLETANCITTLRERYLNHFNLSTDAKLIAISCGGFCRGILILIDGTNGNILVHSIEDDPVTTVAISSNKKFIAFGLANGKVKVLNIETQKCSTLGVPDYTPMEGYELKDDEIVRIWHTGDVESVTFSSDNKMIISGSLDNTIKLWDFKTGKLIRTFEGDSKDILNELGSQYGPFRLNLSGIFSVVVGQNNNIIVAGLNDGIVKIWQIDLTKGLVTILKEIQQNISKINYNNK